MARVYLRPVKGSSRGRWFLDYVDTYGRRRREATGAQTKTEAQQLLRAKLTEQVKAKILGIDSTEAVKPVSFETFFKETYLPGFKTRVQLGDCRESSLKRILLLAKHVLPHFGHMPLRSIKASHVRAFLERRGNARRKPSAAELNRERGLLSAVLNEAFRHGLVDVNEARRIKPLKEQAKDLWLKPAEVDCILEQAEPWMRPFIVLAAHTGMREAELCRLKWADLEHSPGWIRVGHEQKNHRVRFIPANSTVQEVIDSQPRRLGPEGQIPFILLNASRGEPFTRWSVCHAFKRAARQAAKVLAKAGRPESAERVEAATFHTLRHTFASWAIQQGIPIAEVQQYLGHATDHMTRRYAHLVHADGKRRSALEALTRLGHSPTASQARQSQPV